MRKEKSYEELEFTDDYMFSKVLNEEPGLCRELVQLILGRPVREVKPPEIQREFKPGYEARGIQLDVYMEDTEKTLYNIEMQVQIRPNLAKRSRYYHSTLDVASLGEGNDYKALKDTYVIFICKESAGLKPDAPIYEFRMRDQKNGITLDEGTCTIWVNAACKSGDVSGILKGFLEYIRTGRVPEDTEPDHLIRRLQAKVEDIRTSECWRTEYMTFESKVREYEDEAREEGLQEGRLEGRMEGRMEGLRIGGENMLKELVEAGLLSQKVAAKKLGITEEAFRTLTQITDNR